MSQFSSVAQSYLTLCDPMNCSTPGLPVHHQLPFSKNQWFLLASVITIMVAKWQFSTFVIWSILTGYFSSVRQKFRFSSIYLFKYIYTHRFMCSYLMNPLTFFFFLTTLKNTLLLLFSFFVSFPPFGAFSYWNTIDLQYCVSFRYTVIHTHVFFFRFFSLISYYEILIIVPCVI